MQACLDKCVLPDENTEDRPISYVLNSRLIQLYAFVEVARMDVTAACIAAHQSFYDMQIFNVFFFWLVSKQTWRVLLISASMWIRLVSELQFSNADRLGPCREK